ncbi:MAG: tRNA pseudouridine(38-40) synthase TruA [Acidobacteria bacterium]|nr:tRNA pseudouridine(38-40) synthase TruA [Acidobacteriota bacterium]
MTRTLKLTIAYDGARFVGWQRQAEGISIQGLLEEALARFEGAPVTVHGAGRTDAGVHALGQVASVQITSAHATAAVARGLNASLPPDVRVTDVQEAAADFHARFRARSKTYRYLLRNASQVSPFERAYVWHVPEPLDVDAMRTAAKALVGTHDFAAFHSSGSAITDTVRTITRSEIVRDAGRARLSPPCEPDQARHAAAETLLAYEVSGDGFLRHMVRAIVGTLVEIGRGRRGAVGGGRPAASMAELLAGGSRAQAGATAPPQGLFLVRVEYDSLLANAGDRTCRLSSS